MAPPEADSASVRGTHPQSLATWVHVGWAAQDAADEAVPTAAQALAARGRRLLWPMDPSVMLMDAVLLRCAVQAQPEEPSADMPTDKAAYVSALNAYQGTDFPPPASNTDVPLTFGAGAFTAVLEEQGRLADSSIAGSDSRGGLTPDEQALWAARFRDAWQLIQAVDADLFLCMQQTVALVICHKRSAKNLFSGGTLTSMTGAIWLTPTPDWTVMDLADRMVHEYTHTALNLHDALHGVFADAEALADPGNEAWSTFRHVGRPYDMALHAAAVSGVLAVFMAEAGRQQYSGKYLSDVRAALPGLLLPRRRCLRYEAADEAAAASPDDALGLSGGAGPELLGGLARLCEAGGWAAGTGAVAVDRVGSLPASEHASAPEPARAASEPAPASSSWTQAAKLCRQVDLIDAMLQAPDSATAACGDWCRRRHVRHLGPFAAAGATPTCHPLQRPALFWPGLDSRPWHAPAEQPWTAPLAAAGLAPAIRADLEAMLAGDRSASLSAAPADALKAAGSARWVTTTGTKQRPDAMRGLWRTLTLVDGGVPVPGAAEALPAAMRAVAAVAALLPGGWAAGRLDYAGAFHLGPQSAVAPHCASTNLRLRAHLGVAVPKAAAGSGGTPPCQLRIAGEARSWAEGGLLVFDDSFQHDAWNSSDAGSGGGTTAIGPGDRYILCVDVLHPSLSDEQAATVRRLRLLDDFA